MAGGTTHIRRAVGAKHRRLNNRKRSARRLILQQLEDRRVLATLSGPINTDVVLPGGQVHQITDDVTVNAKLTIQPGAIVKFRHSGVDLIVNGELDAQGTASQNIIFTSLLDDVGGDTNLDGGATTPAPGNWSRIRVNGTANIAHANIRYGGHFVGSMLQSNGGTLALSNSVIAHSATDGVRIDDSNPTLTANSYLNNLDAAVSMDLNSNPVITGVTVSDNGINGLQVDAGTAESNLTWNDADIVYWLHDDVTIPTGLMLEIDPGQIVKPRHSGVDLLVDGTLNIAGTASDPVVFTSFADDSEGGDTNGDDSAIVAVNGHWGRIYLRDDSSGNTIDHLQSHFGGHFVGDSLLAADTDVTISNSTFTHSASDAVRLVGTDAVLTGNTFTDNWDAAISMDLNSNPSISGVMITGNGINGLQVDSGSLGKSLLWNDPDIVYWLHDDVTVPEGMTLQIDAGQIVKPRHSGVDIYVDGTFQVTGTEARPVVFTSFADDLHGGDTNGDDGASVALPGQWGRIDLRDASVGNSVNYLQSHFGGHFVGHSFRATLTDLSITNSTFTSSASDAVRLQGTDAVMTNNAFSDNGDAAISMDLNSNPDFVGVAVSGNAINGLQVDSGATVKDLQWNDPDIVYWLHDDVTVPTGLTLQIDAGQVVKPRHSGVDIIVDGTLDITGTASAPVVMTSFADDSRGGDTNNDGSTAIAAPGQWGRILLRDDSTGNSIRYLESYFGGHFVGESLQATDTDLSITGSTFAYSAADAVRLDGTDAVMTSNTFLGNLDAAVSMDLNSNPEIMGVTVIDNGINGLQVSSGTLGKNLIWNDPDIVYWLDHDVTVPDGLTLQIDAGQIIKPSNSGSDILVDGSLHVTGTVDQPVVITSFADDTFGGDTNGNGDATAPAPGHWGHILLRDSSVGNTISYLQSHFGGHFIGDTLRAENTDLSVDHSTFTTSASDAIRLVGTDAILSENEFYDNAGAAIRMDLNSNPTITGSSPVVAVGNGINGLTVDSGSLGKDLIWDDPDIVYWLNDVTVPTGRKLTIEAGQAIKFSNSGGEIWVEGTIDVNGTSQAPVTFTSHSDDSVGGDTNGNGDATVPAPGHWGRILLRAGSADNSIDHARFLYGGHFVGSMVFASNAPADITNSWFSYSASDAIGAGTGATVTASNNVMAGNADTAIMAGSGSQITALNNTIDGNLHGVISHGAGTSVELLNNLITSHGGSGVASQAGGALTAQYNNVFNPDGTNYSGLTDPTGTGGNTSLPPKYFNADNQQYFLMSGSPAIDSAHGDHAPATDRLGNARFDDPNVINTGTGSILFADRGAYERQETSTSDTDLATVSVTGATAGVQDEMVTVNWSAQSVGGESATGTWHDGVYLSVDTVWSPDDIFLGRFEHTGNLGPGQTYSASGDVALPGVLPGPHYFIVRADVDNAVFEGLKEPNNAAASSETISVDLPALLLDQPTAAHLDATGDFTYFKVATPAGADLLIDLIGPAGRTNELYVSYGQLPTRQSFDFRGVRPDSADQSISFGNTRAGSYYVLVYGADVATPETMTVTASLSGFGITGVTPFQGSNLGEVTISVRGAQFDNHSEVRLVDSGGATIDASDVYYTDSGLISATVDLTGAELGLADVQVINAGSVTTSLPDAFNIVTGVPGHLVANIIAPGRLRLGRDFDLIVEYSNQGDTDLLAPVMHLTGQGLTELSLYEDRSSAATVLPLVGAAARHPAGILPPGASHQIHVYGSSISAGNEQLSLVVGSYPNEPIDWATLGSSLRPEGLTDTEWQLLLAELQANIGTSWDSYQAVIADDATLITPRRGLNYSLPDVFRLEIEKALANIGPAVRGDISVNGTTLTDANLTLSDPATGATANTISYSDGSFLFPQVADGTYELTIDGYVVASPQQIVVAGTHVSGVNVIAERGAEIRGAVVSENGVPLRDVPITAVSDSGHSAVAESMQDGTFIIDSLPAGTYQVQAGGEQYVSSTISGIAVELGELKENVSFVLQSGRTIGGSVQGPDGPIAAATIIAQASDGRVFGTLSGGDDDELELEDQPSSLAIGEYLLTALPPEMYTVEVVSDQYGSQIISGVDLQTANSRSGVNFVFADAGWIEGTVTSAADGSGIPGALLTAESATGSYNVLSGDDGSYQLMGLPPASYDVVASDIDFMSANSTINVVAGTGTTLDFSLTELGTVTGTVIDSVTSDPVEKIVVYAADGTGLVTATTTDQLGNYTLDGLDAGRYEIIVGDRSDPGIARQSVTLDPGNVNATANFSIEVVGVLSGKVFEQDGVTPLADAVVALVEDGNIVATMLSEDQGDYAFVLVSSGTFQIEAHYETLAFPPQSGIVVAPGTRDDSLHFVGGNESASGIVRDAASLQGIDSAIVSIKRTDHTLASIAISTEADGSFVWTDAVAGTYEATVFAEGYARQTVSLAIGGTPVSLTVDLDPGVSASGSVRDAVTTELLAGATVLLSTGSDTVVDLIETDESGNYQFTELPEGTYDLTVIAEGRESVVRRDLTINSPNQRFDFSLQPSTTNLSGQVTNGSVALPGAFVFVEDSDGFLVAETITGSDGTYQITTLAAGTFSVFAVGDGYRLSSPIVQTIAEGQTINNLELPITAVAIPDMDTVPVDALVTIDGDDLRAPPPGFKATTEEKQTWANLKAQKARNVLCGRCKDAMSGVAKVLKAARNKRADLKTDYQAIKAKRKEDFDHFTQVSDTSKKMAEKINEILGDWTYALLLDKKAKTKLKQLVADIGTLRSGLQDFLNKYKAGDFDGAKQVIENLTKPGGPLDKIEIRWDTMGFRFADVLGYDTSIYPKREISATTGKIYEQEKKLLEQAAKTKATRGYVKQAFGGITLGIKSTKEMRQNLDSLLKNLPDYKDYLDKLKLYKRDLDFLTKAFKVLRTHCYQVPLPPPKPNPSPAPDRMAEGEITLFFFPVCRPVPPLDPPDGEDWLSILIAILTSFDPNDKIGPSGFGDEGFMQNGLLSYEVQFENDPDLGATIPAEKVKVTDQLDDDLDWTSVEFGTYGFNNFKFDVPPGLSHYETTIDLRPEGIELLVPVVLDVDQKTGELTALFSSLDPLTGLPPDDVDAGFLPVNDKQLHNGEGFFTYHVRPLATAVTGTEIRNQAFIKFDVNEEIPTPKTLHTIDDVAPTSRVAELPEAFGTAEFSVDWSGQDNAGGSGVASYDIYMAQDNGPYELMLADTTETSHVFTGVSGSTYKVLSVARDNVGHVEPMPTAADAETLIIIGAWHNDANPFDVNDRSGVTALDALLVINELGKEIIFDPATKILTPLPPPGYAPPYVDVTGEGKISALDALRVINEIRRLNLINEQPGGEQASVSQASVSQAGPTIASMVANRDLVDLALMIPREAPTTELVAGVDSPQPTPHPIDLYQQADGIKSGNELESSLSMLADDVARQWALAL